MSRARARVRRDATSNAFRMRALGGRELTDAFYVRARCVCWTQGYNSGQIRGNECAVGLVCIIFMLRFPQFFVWQKLWDLGFKTSGGAPRYVDYNNPAATTQPQQREMSSPSQTPREPVGSPFAQPPHASSVVVRSPPPAPPAFSPTPISPPAVVSFTPASPSNNNV